LESILASSFAARSPVLDGLATGADPLDKGLAMPETPTAEADGFEEPAGRNETVN
jgi:hypothetical protein